MQGFAGKLQHNLGCLHSTFNSSGSIKQKCKAPKQAAERAASCQAAAGVTNVKLPATHLEASQRALDEIRATSVGTPNRECDGQLISVRLFRLQLHKQPVSTITLHQFERAGPSTDLSHVLALIRASFDHLL